MRARFTAACFAAAALGAAACSSPPPSPPTEHLVDLSWAPNHERGVNGPGGGYRVSLPGTPKRGAVEVDLPYADGFAPTSLSTTLWSGDYDITVSAYAPPIAAGAPGVSAPATIHVHVP